MAQSYRSRLNGNTREFLDDVKTYGVWEAMRKYGFKDYLSTRRLIMEETQDENYGMRPGLTTYYEGGISGAIHEFMATSTTRIIRLEEENKLLKRQLEVYQRYDKKEEINLASELLGVAESLRQRT